MGEDSRLRASFPLDVKREIGKKHKISFLTQTFSALDAETRELHLELTVVTYSMCDFHNILWTNSNVLFGQLSISLSSLRMYWVSPPPPLLLSPFPSLYLPHCCTFPLSHFPYPYLRAEDITLQAETQSRVLCGPKVSGPMYHFPALLLGFPGGSDSKESACNEGDLGS